VATTRSSRALALRPSGPPLDLTRDLTLLSDLVAASSDPVEDLLRRGLDALQRLVPYDLATAFLLDGSRLVAKVARGRLAGPDVRDHVLSLESAAPLREALESRRARAFLETDHAQDGDAWDGVLDLPPGHGCMVVPLCAGDRCLGLITLDREACVPYEPGAVLLAEVYGQVLALALRGTEERAALERLHQQDHEHAKLLEARLSGDARPQLDASKNATMQEVVRRAHQVAAVDTPVLVLGETGTGKERLSRALHLWSRRADQPFVVVNTAAIPAELLESELFGHVKGAFTGATRDRAGRFSVANGGTLLLDEIGELQLDLQAKLLRVLQEGTLQPVGSDRTVKVDVRVLAATHVDLERAVAAGRFRADLYYRLAVFPLRLPPLRERLDDLPALCEALLAEQAGRTGRRGLRVGPAALARLAAYAWPGNLRELANVLERAAITAPKSVLTPEDLDLPDGRLTHVHALTPTVDESGPVPTLEQVERAHITKILARTQGKLYGDDGAAKLLGVPPSTLQSRMKKLGIKRLTR
jgi:transcriptional regulator with GAF, ATPase, and Fis domain